MNNSIYCSPTHFKLISGDLDASGVKIRKYAELPLPAGGMINGIITDDGIMTEFFARMNSSYKLAKDPTFLVINNNNIRARSIEVPPVSDDMVVEFIRREFTQHGGESTDEVYDYTVLSPKGANGGTQILAVGVSAELLRSYRKALTAAGFDLKNINIGLNCQIKLARFLPQLKQGTVILLLIDGRSLTLTLFENGMYRVSNRYRLSQGENDATWAKEIGGNISSMIQFNKTQKDSAQVTAAYIAGTSGTNISNLRFTLSYLGIDIQGLDMSGHVMIQSGLTPDGAKPFDTGDFLLNIGNLLKK
jgi:hypothetical protein